MKKESIHDKHDFFENYLKPELSAIFWYIMTEGKRIFEKNKFEMTEKQKETQKSMKGYDGCFSFLEDGLQAGEESEAEKEFCFFQKGLFKFGDGKSKKYNDEGCLLVKPSVYQDYVIYCQENGFRAENKISFKMKIEKQLPVFLKDALNKPFNDKIEDVMMGIKNQRFWLFRPIKQS